MITKASTQKIMRMYKWDGTHEDMIIEEGSAAKTPIFRTLSSEGKHRLTWNPKVPMTEIKKIKCMVLM